MALARQIPMKMADWVAKLDAFLQLKEYEVLANAGKVSAEVAKRLAEEQYDRFRVRQDREFESDFEAEVERIGLNRPRKRGRTSYDEHAPTADGAYARSLLKVGDAGQWYSIELWNPAENTEKR